MKCITNNSPQYALNFGIEEKHKEESVNKKFFILKIENYLNWKNRVDQMSPKLSRAYYTVRYMFHINNTDTLKSIYFAYFHSIIQLK
jgi:hypothetical protein